MNLAPSLVYAAHDGEVEMRAAGSWTAAHASTAEALVDKCVGRSARAHLVKVDLSQIAALDTYGAWLIERLLRGVKCWAADIRIEALPGRFRGLAGQVQHVNTAVLPAAPPWRLFASPLEATGRAVIKGAGEIVSIAGMAGAFTLSLLNAMRRPRDFRLTSAVHHFDRVALQAVPIILLITFLIGGIIAQQGLFHFKKFGADLYVVDMVGILVLREIGVLIVAIMVAGRSGSSYTAELGSMKMREEIDALRTMGLDPVDVLVTPRIVALILALPVLTFLGSLAALYGGGLVAWLYGGMSPDIYVERLREAISITHFKVGMIKAPFMALLIGVVACSQGLQVKGSAESLGLKTTSSVVKSIFLVIIMDGLFAIFFASIDM